MTKTKFCKTFNFLSASLEKTLNNRLKENDLSATQGLVLLWLGDEPTGSLPIKSIEKRFGKSQPTTLGIVKRLEQKKLVSSHLTNQHTKVVTITKEGLLLVGIVKENIKACDEVLFQGFTKEQQVLFVELLEKAEMNLLDYYGIDKGEYDEK